MEQLDMALQTVMEQRVQVKKVDLIPDNQTMQKVQVKAMESTPLPKLQYKKEEVYH